jgi:AcrR family transcriptional regulator
MLPGRLPQVTRPERADARRNREAILVAAGQLFSERGPDAVSMDDIACQAGVGKPTLYRRFGDRAGLVRAVLETRESAFQEAVLRGPPPLGPGAPPAERAAAFLEAYVDRVRDDLPILLAVERARYGMRFDSLYESYRHHVALLVGECRPDDHQADVLVDALLAAVLSPQLYAYHVRRGLDHDAIRSGAGALARRLLDA